MTFRFLHRARSVLSLRGLRLLAVHSHVFVLSYLCSEIFAAEWTLPFLEPLTLFRFKVHRHQSSQASYNLGTYKLYSCSQNDYMDKLQ